MAEGGPGRASPEGGAPVEAVPLVDKEDVIDVLPRDGIPSIDEPRFIRPEEATWVSGREPVVALEIAGDARAYPAQILTRHEIVNDVVGGRPVAVTYCPLCNSALVFERTVNGQVLEFGVSGKLYRSALVMYDRQTKSLWTHFQGVAFEGALSGTDLETVPAQMLSFEDWGSTYPSGRVLSRQTGFDVDYGTNPYAGYDTRDGPYEHFFGEELDPKLPAMQRVVGVPNRTGGIAYPYPELAGPAAGSTVLADRTRQLVIFWRTGTASAVDSSEISSGRDVGATGVFSPEVAGRTLTFAAREGGFRDEQTGSTWSLSGIAQAGPLAGERLRPVEHLDTFWFSWAAYYPETEVYGGDR
jgi:hypothetical protein